MNGMKRGNECVWFAFKRPGEEIANEISVTMKRRKQLLLTHTVRT